MKLSFKINIEGVWMPELSLCNMLSATHILTIYVYKQGGAI